MNADPQHPTDVPVAVRAEGSESVRSAAEVSVIIPTLGRVPQLERALASLTQCHPRASEVLVVDQSGTSAIKRVVERHSRDGVRYVYCDGDGRGRGVNRGLDRAGCETVLITDDDCTVESSWIGAALHALNGRPFSLATGQVRPPHDAAHVPSTITYEDLREYEGHKHRGVLAGGNMAGMRSALLGIGGFDEHLVSAEDNDFCYRWLRAGGVIRYDPSMVIWHHDWRSPEQLEQLYVRYARGEGMFYAKHLRRGDLGVLRFLAQDIRQGAKAELRALRHNHPRSGDRKLGILRGLPSGIASGLRNVDRRR